MTETNPNERIIGIIQDDFMGQVLVKMMRDAQELGTGPVEAQIMFKSGHVVQGPLSFHRDEGVLKARVAVPPQNVRPEQIRADMFKFYDAYFRPQDVYMFNVLVTHPIQA